MGRSRSSARIIVDEAYAIAPTIDLVKQADEEGCDAIILACFCDVGVEAAKEISSIPVFGLEETTLSVALLLDGKFGIMTEKRPRVAMKELHVRRHGLLERVASIRPLELSVAELDADPRRTKATGMALARRMVAEALVDLGLTHSRVGLYAPPTPKEFK